MKTAILYVDRPYLNDQMFNSESFLNRDDCLSFYRELKREFFNIGIELHTQDLVKPEMADVIIFSDVPKNRAVLDSYKIVKTKIVLLYESEVIKPWNWDRNRHEDFDFIFTWNDDIVDNIKYFKFNFSFDLNKLRKQILERHNKYDLVLFCGNHRSNHPNAVYHLRRELINWFEENRSELIFKFWGPGWTHDFKWPVLSNKITRRLFKNFSVFYKRYRNYSGFAKDKISILSEAKFCFCIENAIGFNGYITEKLFDCLRGRCIPIYMGPPNVDLFIPKNCYIDYNKFNSVGDINAYLLNMSSDEYFEKIVAIENFIQGPQAYSFHDTTNVSSISEQIQKRI